MSATPKKYRKQPVVIEAMRYDGSNAVAVVRWFTKHLDDPAPYVAAQTGDLVIPTLEGDMRASVGDWIIRGVQGEFYPCKPAIFEATYEPVEPVVSLRPKRAPWLFGATNSAADVRRHAERIATRAGERL